jgi:hypothetical protein
MLARHTLTRVDLAHQSPFPPWYHIYLYFYDSLSLFSMYASYVPQQSNLVVLHGAINWYLLKLQV